MFKVRCGDRNGSRYGENEILPILREGAKNMKETICDLCKKPINDEFEDTYKWKIKRYNPFFEKWMVLDAHPRCVEAVVCAARERKEKNV